MDTRLIDFFSDIDSITPLNLLNNKSTDAILEGIRKDVKNIFVLEVTLDGFYKESQLWDLPRIIQHGFRFAENRPWRYYLFDFDSYKKLSIGAFGGTGARTNEYYFSPLVQESVFAGKIEKHSIALKDILLYFDTVDGTRKA